MRERPDGLTERIADLCRKYLREPVGFYREDGQPIVEFDPPLTTQEQAAFAEIVRVARLPFEVTRHEWQMLSPALDTLRQFRQTTDQQFAAMTAAQRDQALIAAQRATIDLLRVVLRD